MIETDLHMSLLPLFICIQGGIMWAPNVNHRKINPNNAYNILNENELKNTQKDINSNYCIFPFTIKNNNDNNVQPTIPMESTYLIPLQDFTLDVKKSTLYAQTITKDHIKKLLDTNITKHKKKTFNEMLNQVFDSFRTHKLTDTTSSMKFIQDFKLKDNTDKLLDITNDKNIHVTILKIQKSFKTKYNLYFEFIEGNHRCFSILFYCLNMKYDDKTRMINTSNIHKATKQLSNTSLDMKAPVRIITTIDTSKENI